MKSFAVIIALYVCWLAVIPCSQDFCADDHAQHGTAADGSTHHDCSDDETGCTPFCLDKCCASGMYSPRFSVTLTGPVPVLTPHHDHYTEQYITANYALIWQPPKVS